MATVNSVKWNRSQEGYCTSKCGTYEIQPLFMGCDKPQSYHLVKNGERIASYCETQKEAKSFAN